MRKASWNGETMLVCRKQGLKLKHHKSMSTIVCCDGLQEWRIYGVHRKRYGVKERGGEYEINAMKCSNGTG